MKKMDIIASCEQCSQCLKYITQDCRGEAFFCGATTDRLIEAARNHLQNVAIPDWCPLETYKDSALEESVDSAAPAAPAASQADTIILSGLPHLEWMTENLKGFGGTEIDGRWYYTYEQAEEAVKQLGNGWRIPTRGEMVDLDDFGSEWQEEGPHGLPGRLFGGGLFLDAAGGRNSMAGTLGNVGTNGYVWSSSSRFAGDLNAGYLGFHSSGVYSLGDAHRAAALSVRCVRNRQ